MRLSQTRSHLPFPFLSKVETDIIFLRFASMAVFTVNSTFTTSRASWRCRGVQTWGNYSSLGVGIAQELEGRGEHTCTKSTAGAHSQREVGTPPPLHLSSPILGLQLSGLTHPPQTSVSWTLEELAPMRSSHNPRPRRMPLQGLGTQSSLSSLTA